MSSNTRLVRHYMIRAWQILFAGLYLLVFHVLWTSHAWWADLIVAILYLAPGLKGVLARPVPKAD